MEPIEQLIKIKTTPEVLGLLLNKAIGEAIDKQRGQDDHLDREPNRK